MGKLVFRKPVDGQVELQGNARFAINYKKSMWQEITLKEVPEILGSQVASHWSERYRGLYNVLPSR